MFSHLLQKIRTIFSHPSYWRAIIACHYNEPLHYHHDGCPACIFEWSRPPTCVEDGCTNTISDPTDGWVVCDVHLKALSEYQNDGRISR